MPLVPINDWSKFRNIFSEEGLSYEFKVMLNGGLKSSKVIACLSSSDDPKQEIYEIENFIDDSIETVTLETLMIDNAHILRATNGTLLNLLNCVRATNGTLLNLLNCVTDQKLYSYSRMRIEGLHMSYLLCLHRCCGASRLKKKAQSDPGISGFTIFNPLFLCPSLACF